MHHLESMTSFQSVVGKADGRRALTLWKERGLRIEITPPIKDSGRATGTRNSGSGCNWMRLYSLNQRRSEISCADAPRLKHAGSLEQEVNSSHSRAAVNVITTAGPARLIASAQMIHGLLREGRCNQAFAANRRASSDRPFRRRPPKHAFRRQDVPAS